MVRTRFSTKRQPRRGFTLIELLVVISIIAVLVGSPGTELEFAL